MDTGSDTVSRGMVGGLLERAARAVPAAVEGNSHGWWLRHTDSSMWWSGAVLAHGHHDHHHHDHHEPSTLGAGIEAAEEFYASHHAPARFQICAGCPPGLDRTPSDRGYRPESPMSLQIAMADDVAHGLSAPGLQVHLTEHLGPAWFTAWRAATGTPAHRPSEWRLFRRVRAPVPT